MPRNMKETGRSDARRSWCCAGEAADVLLFDAEAPLRRRCWRGTRSGVGDGALQHDARGAEVLAAVDEGDLGGEAGEEERLFHGGVAAADDGDLLAGGEEAVAGGAGADAVADERLLEGRPSQRAGAPRR
jgi:hypothetical protein